MPMQSKQLQQNMPKLAPSNVPYQHSTVAPALPSCFRGPSVLNDCTPAQYTTAICYHRHLMLLIACRLAQLTHPAAATVPASAPKAFVTTDAGCCAARQVDGDPVPVPHFGLALSVEQFHALADRLKAAGIKFVIEPHLRFVGKPGEQVGLKLPRCAQQDAPPHVAAGSRHHLRSPCACWTRTTHCT
jgi:hypothetical protein